MTESSTYYVIGKLAPEDDCRDFNPGEILMGEDWILDIFHAGISVWKAGETRDFGDVKQLMIDAMETAVGCFNLITDLKLRVTSQSWLEARGVVSKHNVIGWFMPRMDARWTFERSAAVNDIWRRIGSFVFRINDSFYHKMALRDYRSSMENSGDDAFFYAYRMLEDIRRAVTQKYDAESNWPEMHAILGTNESELKPLTDVATKVRHGQVHDPLVKSARGKSTELLKLGADVLIKEFNRTFPGLVSPPFAVSEVKEKINKWASGIPRIKKMYLFGSFANGKERPNDIDVAAEITPSAEDANGVLFWFDSHTRMEEELTRLLGFSVDLEKLDDESPTIMAGVEKNSILVYEKESEEVNS